MGVLSLAVFCLSACDRDLDVEQFYPFTLETISVQKDIIKGQTAEIRCTLKRRGDFADTRYTPIFSARRQGNTENGRWHGIQAQ